MVGIVMSFNGCLDTWVRRWMQSVRISQKILAVRVIHCGAIHAGAGGVQSSVKSHSAGVIAKPGQQSRSLRWLCQ